jgi:hypothetical protein
MFVQEVLSFQYMLVNNTANMALSLCQYIDWGTSVRTCKEP